MLALLGVQLTAAVRTNLRAAAVMRARAMAEAAADGAVRRAMFLALARPDGQADVLGGGRPIRMRIGETEVEVAVEDEATKINPNMVSMAVLRGLLAAVGVDQPRAARLAGQIVDWRTYRQVSALGGLKIDQYRARGLPYQAGGQPFESIDEIGLVPDMTPDILARVLPFLSVYQDGDLREAKPDSPLAAAVRDARISRNGFFQTGIASQASVLRIAASAVTSGGVRFRRTAVVQLNAPTDWDAGVTRMLIWE